MPQDIIPNELVQRKQVLLIIHALREIGYKGNKYSLTETISDILK